MTSETEAHVKISCLEKFLCNCIVTWQEKNLQKMFYAYNVFVDDGTTVGCLYIPDR